MVRRSRNSSVKVLLCGGEVGHQHKWIALHDENSEPEIRVECVCFYCCT